MCVNYIIFVTVSRCKLVMNLKQHFILYSFEQKCLFCVHADLNYGTSLSTIRGG